ncbi:MAG: hypothetical protein H3C34_09295, partial [Caldilineaceae bacterium]|nr:hypothetical protein [Caldilineaceae bacterium]
QDYYNTIYVPAAAPPVTFTMTVTIVNSRPTPTPEPRVQRITFAPGAISATVRGSVDSRQPMSFVLRALTGQDMTVQTFDGGPYQVTITGEDGSYLGSANAGQTIQARLPATQDYYISFTVPAGAAGSSFTMTVTIVGSSRPTPTPLPAAQRIQFAPGATSATVGGSTPQTFVLRALASQTMVVELYTSGAPARVTVLTQGRETMGTAGENASWIGRLPATGDYYLVIEAPAGADQTGFTLRVSIY